MRKFVRDYLFEAFILLTDNIFYKTTAPGNIIVINKVKNIKAKFY